MRTQCRSGDCRIGVSREGFQAKIGVDLNSASGWCHPVNGERLCFLTGSLVPFTTARRSRNQMLVLVLVVVLPMNTCGKFLTVSVL